MKYFHRNKNTKKSNNKLRKTGDDQLCACSNSQNQMSRKCKLCNKVFSRKSYLKKHIRVVHEKQRPYECDRCKKTFGEKGNLNRHKKKYHV